MRLERASNLSLTLRSERQITAAIIRATKATAVFESYCKSSKKVEFKAWVVYTMKYVELCETCCKRGCERAATKRIAINVHGTVSEADVCDEHADRHGKWIDDL